MDCQKAASQVTAGLHCSRLNADHLKCRTCCIRPTHSQCRTNRPTWLSLSLSCRSASMRSNVGSASVHRRCDAEAAGPPWRLLLRLALALPLRPPAGRWCPPGEPRMRLLRIASEPPAAAPKAAPTASCCCCWSASACRAASTASKEPSLGGRAAAPSAGGGCAPTAGVHSCASCRSGCTAPSRPASKPMAAAGAARMLQELPDSRLTSPPPDDLGAAPRSPVGRAPGEGAPTSSRAADRPPLLPPAVRKDRLPMAAAPRCSGSPAALAGSSITGRTSGLQPPGGGSASAAGVPTPAASVAGSWLPLSPPASFALAAATKACSCKAGAA